MSPIIRSRPRQRVALDVGVELGLVGVGALLE